MNRYSQKGSALLIVLGFLSFMVVSAVAFAIWMRNERLPSSALRRSVANRYLVKAALAQAMSRVDDAIRSHPYPGAWNTNMQSTAYRDDTGCAYDWWESRVFMPPDPEGVGTTPGDPHSRYAPVTKTVSVLNLEALGYLPPAIANDVRLLSRSSWAAQWEYFNFDAGRYAFCAVNVSDMLDISKIAANSPRTSASAEAPGPSGGKPPPSRFSLAYLFRGGESGFASPSGHDTFDRRVHTDLPEWSEAPLVSLMDYNLAMENTKAGILYSPFYSWISGRTTSGDFYAGGDVNSDFVKGAARQPFVTDSWFPRSGQEASLNLYDIAQHQPFLAVERRSLSELDSIANLEFWNMMSRDKNVFCHQDELMLYDYLDENNVPLSLAMPCAERVPMVTTMGVSGDLKVEFEESAQPEEKDVSEKEHWKIFDIKIKVTGLPSLVSESIFPFMSGSGDDSPNYDVQGFMRLAFVDEEANADAESPVVSLRSDGFAELRPKKMADWKDVNDKQFKFPEEVGEPNCLLISSFNSGGSWKPDVSAPKDVFDVGKGGFRLTVHPDLPDPVTIMKRIEVYEITGEGEQKTFKRKTGDDGELYQIVLSPFRKDGTGLAVTDADPMKKSSFDALIGGHNIRPYLMAWVRVKDGSDRTVDLVPAAFADDSPLNDYDNNDVLANIADPFGMEKEKGMPILHFPSKMMFTYANVKDKTAPSAADWKYKSCCTVDPRFNWAPENWWFSQESPSLNGWYTHVFNDGGILDKLAESDFGAIADNRRGDRARDPVLFVSNLGYLQSVGELAFLPRLSEIENTTQSGCAMADGLYNGAVRDFDADQDVVKNMPCSRVAWKSYQNYRTNPNAFEFGANLYRRGLINGPQSFYVNPFTQSKEVMLAAFANTPLNYWVAGTNYVASGKSGVNQNKFDKQYVFDADPSFRADYLAEYMMHRYEDLANMLQFTGGMDEKRSYMRQKIWEDMFDALDWGGRMNENKKVEEIYDELKDYYSGGGGASDYKNMYMKKNGYGELNSFVTGSALPGIDLDVSRAVHKDEFADPLYYYNERRQPPRNPTAGDYICDADRMFLHSYWRDCFANRQQLFLIFVRAESTALGGTGEGTPAQQGGRAVALVWRDPEASQYSSDVEHQGWGNNDTERQPHKMRVLFYRQLD